LDRTGIRNVKDTIKRAKSFEDAVEKAGGKSLGFYYTIAAAYHHI
jgi:uncharacterized protein with GYD domain